MNEIEKTVTEQAAEAVEVADEPKIYSEREHNEKTNKLLGQKIARKEAKIRKEYEEKYRTLEEAVKVGTGSQTVEEATSKIVNFYKSKGLEIPDKKDYSAKDIERLAKADAEDIISAGYDEVVEEVDRLTKLGLDKMTARDKILFRTLAEHRQNAERNSDLAKLGVTEDVYNSEEFRSFASKFNPNTPIADVYDIWAKTQPKKDIQTMGSLTNKTPDTGAVKDFYTAEEARKFTKKDFDKNPKLYKAVLDSMPKW